jgi:copper(I)-binding protein
MTLLNRRHFLLFGTATLALAACGPAADMAPPKITVKKAWMRVPPGGRDVSAAYLVIVNEGGADTLVSVSSPMADDVQMHISEMSDDVMSMREESTVPIPAKDTLNYQPGGRHLMVFGVREGLKAGDEVPFILTFLHAGEITVTAIMGNGPA